MSRTLLLALESITPSPRMGEELSLGASSASGDCAWPPWPGRWWGACFPPFQHPLLGFLQAPSGWEGANSIERAEVAGLMLSAALNTVMMEVTSAAGMGCCRVSGQVSSHRDGLGPCRSSL